MGSCFNIFAPFSTTSATTAFPKGYKTGFTSIYSEICGT
jgi:hypothetical protein